MQNEVKIQNLKRLIVLAGGKGFTLVEVAIVMAIALGIMAIAFLAVSQSQRNSRDLIRKSAASRVLAAASSSLGSNGDYPLDCGAAGSAMMNASPNCTTSVPDGTTANIDRIQYLYGRDGSSPCATTVGTSRKYAQVNYWSETANALRCISDK